MPVNVPNPTTVYTLIESLWGVYGDTVGAVEFKATGGLDYTVNLVEGQDIRDNNNDGYNNTIGLGALGGVYLGSASFGGGQVRLDEQAFTLPSSFAIGDPDRHHPARLWRLSHRPAVPHGGNRGNGPAECAAHADGGRGIDRFGGERTVRHVHRDRQRLDQRAGQSPVGGRSALATRVVHSARRTLVNGVAEFTTTSLPAGADTITASYDGTAAFAPSTTGTIVTAVGNGTAGYTGNDGPAIDAELNFPAGIAFDSAGDLFIADYFNNVIREVVKATGDIITVAGNGKAGYTGNTGPATDAELDEPVDMAFDSAGDLFFTDSRNNVVREVVKATGDIITVAGNGTAGYSGDNGLATAAELNDPWGLAIDSAGDLFIADHNNNVVREVVEATGDIITVAGTASVTRRRQTRTAPSCDPNVPDSAGDLFIADSGQQRGPRGGQGDRRHHHRRRQRHRRCTAATADRRPPPSWTTPTASPSTRWATCSSSTQSNNVVREVVKATGDIITVAGNGTAGYSGNNGPATAAELDVPGRVAVDSAGDLFISDCGQQRGPRGHAGGDRDHQPVDAPCPPSRRSCASTASAVAGQSVTFTATVSDLSAGGAIPNGGTVTFSDQNGAIGSATLVDGVAEFTTSSLPAGTDTVTASYGGTAELRPEHHGHDRDRRRRRHRRLHGRQRARDRRRAELSPSVAFDSAGDLFIADTANNVVREVVKATGDIITVAGNGIAGYSGDGGPATDAELNRPVRRRHRLRGRPVHHRHRKQRGPRGGQGDRRHHHRRRQRHRGVQRRRRAGDRRRAGQPPRHRHRLRGRPVLRRHEQQRDPRGGQGDRRHHHRRRQWHRRLQRRRRPRNRRRADGPIGARHRLVRATCSSPTVATTKESGRWSKATGDIITVAGDGTAGYSGDGGPATAAEIVTNGVAVDSVGDLFLTDFGNNVIREVVKATGDIITVAGNGTAGYSGDDGPATAAELYDTLRVAVDPAGHVFVG